MSISKGEKNTNGILSAGTGFQILTTFWKNKYFRDNGVTVGLGYTQLTR